MLKSNMRLSRQTSSFKRTPVCRVCPDFFPFSGADASVFGGGADIIGHVQDVTKAFGKAFKLKDSAREAVEKVPQSNTIPRVPGTNHYSLLISQRDALAGTDVRYGAMEIRV